MIRIVLLGAVLMLAGIAAVPMTMATQNICHVSVLPPSVDCGHVECWTDPYSGLPSNCRRVPP